MLTFTLWRLARPLAVLLADQISLTDELVSLFTMKVNSRVYVVVIGFHVTTRWNFRLRT